MPGVNDIPKLVGSNVLLVGAGCGWSVGGCSAGVI
jgi:hypothetical protein